MWSSQHGMCDAMDVEHNYLSENDAMIESSTYKQITQRGYNRKLKIQMIVVFYKMFF